MLQTPTVAVVPGIPNRSVPVPVENMLLAAEDDSERAANCRWACGQTTVSVDLLKIPVTVVPGVPNPSFRVPVAEMLLIAIGPDEQTARRRWAFGHPAGVDLLEIPVPVVPGVKDCS